ncbi:MAG TPA: aminotransferase class IV [Solirubrobacteraceae bacterium]|nr:aminotransferase class IV [Solirubrobacteraceae bacterium]
MVNTLDTLLRWTGRDLAPLDGEPASALLVADSWLVDEGYERAAAAHWARFAKSCLQLGVVRAELGAFEAAARAALPREGRWFPRVELTAEGLGLRLRRAPRVGGPGSARVLIGPPGDPREAPLRKGPDLALLESLRAGAREHGADELLLCDGSGTLLEGALSSLLWWEDEALCTTIDEHALPGVTRALLLARAGERGVEVRKRAPRPEELDGRETWLTSALHGIRVVRGWVGSPIEAGAAERAPAWREELDRDG